MIFFWDIVLSSCFKNRSKNKKQLICDFGNAFKTDINKKIKSYENFKTSSISIAF